MNFVFLLLFLHFFIKFIFFRLYMHTIKWFLFWQLFLITSLSISTITMIMKLMKTMTNDDEDDKMTDVLALYTSSCRYCTARRHIYPILQYLGSPAILYNIWIILRFVIISVFLRDTPGGTSIWGMCKGTTSRLVVRSVKQWGPATRFSLKLDLHSLGLTWVPFQGVFFRLKQILSHETL